MYLHLGQDALVRACDIVGIFDMDNTTVAKGTRRLLNRAEREGRVVSVTGDLPKSFVVCGQSSRDCKIYLSQISPATLKKRSYSGPTRRFAP